MLRGLIMWPPIIRRIVRALLRRMRAIREAMSMSRPAPTQTVAHQRRANGVSIHKMLQAEVFDATGQCYPVKRYS